MSSSGLPPDEPKELLDKFLDSASTGNMETVKALLKGAVDVNAKNERGWNGLMLAARNGHTNVIRALLEKGCDPNTLNSTGQTAVDIATFWNHTETARILGDHSSGENPDQNCRNFFSVNQLNRLAEKRKNMDWIGTAMKLPTTIYLLFSDLKPYVTDVPKKSSQSDKRMGKFQLARFCYDDIKFHIATDPSIVLLGAEQRTPQNKESSMQKSSEPDVEGITENGSVYFAMDVSGIEEERIVGGRQGVSLMSVAMPGALQLASTEAGLFSEARSLLAWHDRYRFCPTCGSSTHCDEAGYKRTCDNAECRSHKGIHNTCYPRVDPSMIMLVVSPDGHQCLLGRGKHFPRKMFSCLAGYMEPGESLEDTCRREVEEESGIQIGRVDYHSSQPWPFPAVLMLGCIAHATTTQVKVDEDELEDARWFSRPEIVQMLTSQHPEGLFIPPAQAIAHQLIRSWVRMTANL